MSFNFVKFRKIFFIFSGLLIIGCFSCLILFGLKLGIDFTGGSILEIEYKNARPSNQEIRDSLSSLDLGDFSVQPTGDKGVILRTKDLSSDLYQQVLGKLQGKGDMEEKRFESIGPVVGKELREKTIILIIAGLLAMLVYISVAFRKVSKPVNSWQYGIASILMLSHDVLIPLGVFSILGKFYGVQITIPIIAALLTIVGYAINNVVVVYDRMRENILRSGKSSFDEITNSSINQTLTRQLSTSLTTLFPLLAIFFLGGATLKYFALALILGISAGTYSSIFLAAPILVSWLNLRRKRY